MLAIVCILVGVLSRFLIVAPNFNPFIAVALFGGVYLSRRWALIVPVAILALSDVFLGLHAYMLFTWLAAACIAGMGLKIRRRKTTGTLFAGGLFAAFFYYIVTNFGYWLFSGLYAHNFSGLLQCYLAAIPYFRYMLMSTLLYGVILFGAYELLARRLAKTRFADFLLSA